MQNGRAVPETTRVINDVASFFQKPFAKVLSDFTNATEDKIAAIVKMKIERQSFETRLIPLSQVDQYLGLAGGVRNGTGFDFFGGS